MRRYEPEDFFGFSIGLPCEPGRGLCQNLALKLHLAQLPAKLHQLLPLGGVRTSRRLPPLLPRITVTNQRKATWNGPWRRLKVTPIGPILNLRFLLSGSCRNGSGEHLKLKVQRTHPGKMQAAKLLVSKYKLPDASTLLAFFTRSRRVRDPLAPGAGVELAAAQSGKFHC